MFYLCFLIPTIFNKQKISVCILLYIYFSTYLHMVAFKNYKLDPLSLCL